MWTPPFGGVERENGEVASGGVGVERVESGRVDKKNGGGSG
jgi:hypothetical protein